jgi:hypothetical protein
VAHQKEKPENSVLLIIERTCIIATLLCLVVGLSSMIASFLAINLHTYFFDNWLVLFAKVNSGIFQFSSLSVLAPIDFILLALIGVIYFIVFISLHKNLLVYILGIIAVASPFFGIILLVQTHNAGRTGLLTATVLLCICMIDNTKGKISTMISGITSGIGLLVLCDYLSMKSINMIYSYTIAIFYVIWIFFFCFLLKSTGSKKMA